MSERRNLVVREGPPKPEELEALERAARKQQRVELALALLPLALIGVGCYLVYPPAGLVVPGLLAWWDNREPPPPATPQRRGE